MKATDLMTGDLLKWKEQPGFNDEDRNTVLRVKNIFDDTIKIDGRFELYHISLFEPIPLTPEILEKNGFIKSEEDPILTGGIGCAIIYGGYKRLDEDKFLNYGDNIYPIRYVHQLQHALRLCGIERTIEL